MEHNNLVQSTERKRDYRSNLKVMSNNTLLDAFIGVYLEQDFPTDFDRWMAEQDVSEFKKRLIGFVER